MFFSQQSCFDHWNQTQQEMASTSRPKIEDLLCLVCCDVFADLVLLSCSHSVCKACLRLFWEIKESPECPVCRRKSSKLEPPLNPGTEEAVRIVLRGPAIQRAVRGVWLRQKRHKRHKNHRFCPLDEVLSDIKVIFFYSAF